jgi:hypothetical protein
VAQAEEWVADLIERKQWVDVQLGDRDKRGPDGERMAGGDYWAWRKRAVGAKVHLERRINELRRWIKARRIGDTRAMREERWKQAGVSDGTDPWEVLAGLYFWLGGLIHEPFAPPLSEAERNYVISTRALLRGRYGGRGDLWPDPLGKRPAHSED